MQPQPQQPQRHTRRPRRGCARTRARRPRRGCARTRARRGGPQAPFTDDALYNEQYQKAGFWTHPNFYGVDLAPLKADALEFYFSQPVVGP